LAMELVISLLVLYAADRLYQSVEPAAGFGMRLLVQAAMVFSVSLLVLTFGGMEHVLQILADLLFLGAAGYRLAGGPVGTRWLCALAILSTAARYEGLFLVFVACLALLVTRRWMVSIATGIFALIPVAAMALFNMAHGSHALPNSLLIKAANPDQIHLHLALFGPRLQGILGSYAWRHGVAEIFLACCGLLVMAVLQREAISPRVRWMLIVYVGTALLHSQFSRLGWIYRYEGYLLALGSFLVFCGMHELWRARSFNRLAVPAALACGLSALCLLPRTVVINSRIPHHTRTVYEQQYQMGRFLETYYPGVAIAANDIGNIAYFSNHEILDLAGLATVEVTDLLARNAFTTDAIRRLAQRYGIQIAVAYPTWFTGSRRLPPEWIPVETWTLDESHADALGGLEVMFYAVQPEQAGPLAARLKAYAPELPNTVEQRSLR
jgi:hypothetical protein